MVVSLKFYISGGGYDYKQSFSGRISQLVMMSRALEADEVAQVNADDDDDDDVDDDDKIS